MEKNISVLDIKKRKLKRELSKEEPNEDIVIRLKKSIKRHKKMNKSLRNVRTYTKQIKNKK